MAGKKRAAVAMVDAVIEMLRPSLRSAAFNAACAVRSFPLLRKSRSGALSQAADPWPFPERVSAFPSSGERPGSAARAACLPFQARERPGSTACHASRLATSCAVLAIDATRTRAASLSSPHALSSPANRRNRQRNTRAERLLRHAGSKRPGRGDPSQRADCGRAGGPIDTRKDAGKDCNSSRLRATSRSANSRCTTARATASTRTWADPTSCTTWSPRRSSRSNRAAGAFRSRAASRTAAISTRQRARSYGRKLSLRGDDVSVDGVADLLHAGPPAGSGVRFDARLARHAPRRHDLPRTRARAALLRRRQRGERGVRERGRGRRHSPLAAAARAGQARSPRTRPRWRDRRTSQRCCATHAAGSRSSMPRARPRRPCASRSSANSAGSSSATSSCVRAGAGMPDTTAGLRACSTMRTWRQSRLTRIACRACGTSCRRRARCRRSMPRSNRPARLDVQARHAQLCGASLGMTR